MHGLSWVDGDPSFFWRNMDPFWCLDCSQNFFFPKWLVAVCTAVMDVLRWIVLGLHGNQGTGQVNGTYK